MSRHSRPILQRIGMQSRQIWRGCHTSVGSGDLSQAPSKQSAVCSTCIIPAPPANCQFIWMACALGLSATQPILGDSRPYTVLQRTLDEDCRQAEEPKQLVDEAIAGATWGASAHTLRPSALALCYSAGEYGAPVWSRSAHTSKVDVQLNSTMRLISGTLRSTPLPWLPVLSNIEPPPYERRLPSWWRKSSNMTVGQSSLISLALHCCD